MATAGELTLNVPGQVYIQGMVSSTAFGTPTGEPSIQGDLQGRLEHA